MTMRAPTLLLVAIVGGVLAGSGLAGLADPLPNDPCLDYGSLPEGSSSSSSFEVWPLGLNCEYRVGDRLARSGSFGPTTAELYAWIGAATLLAAMAQLRRGSAFVRGAATMACLLALSGAIWMYAGAQIALSASVVLGAPVAFGLDHRLRPAAMRSVGASLYVAVALAALAFCAVFGVLISPLGSIAIAVLAGGFASMRIARPPRLDPITT